MDTDPAKLGAGFHEMTEDQYFALDAVNQSTLKWFDYSPAHARHYMLTGGERTKPMAFGAMVDVAFFEPQRFDEEFGVPPKADRRTKAGSAAWAAFEVDHPHMVGTTGNTRWAISAADRDKALELAAAVRDTEAGKVILEAEGRSQVVAVWQDEATGVWCKARMDRVCVLDGLMSVVDLKTTFSHAVIREWERQIANYAYHVQAGWYTKALEALGYGRAQFFHLVAERHPPHGVRLFQVSTESLVIGQTQCEKYLRQYAVCKERNEWPSYPLQAPTVGLPRWAEPGEEIDDE